MNFDKIAENLTPFQQAWIKLCGMDKCIWCNKKYLDGIVKKHPREIKFILNAYFLFNSDFLVHTKTTHGLEPEDLTMFLKESFK